jgi:hypothetical protein
MNKVVLCPERIRRIPPQFSWVDHALARRRLFERAPVEAWALYLFWLTVADAEGVSYYAERTLCRRLAINAAVLERARDALVHLGLVAYRAPLVQVLAVPSSTSEPLSSTPASQRQVRERLAELRAQLNPRGNRS